MRHFLIIYDRRKGRILELHEYGPEEAAKASADRFERERVERADANIEVVLLGADSLDQVKATHSRYFFGEPGFKFAF